MKEVLLKKRYGIPAALLALLVLAGIVVAVAIASKTYPATIVEPLSFDTTDTLDIAHPGESDNIRVIVSNASTKEGYGIFVDADVTKGQVKTMTYSSEHVASDSVSKLVSTEENSVIDMNSDGDLWDACYNIADNSKGKATENIVVTVDTAKGAPARDLTIDLAFHRKAKY